MIVVADEDGIGCIGQCRKLAIIAVFDNRKGLRVSLFSDAMLWAEEMAEGIPTQRGDLLFTAPSTV